MFTIDISATREVVSWNAIIVGYAQNGHAREALALFSQMQLVGLIPTSVTMASVLQACADLVFLKQSMCIHAYVLQCGLESDVFVGNSLVVMYAKCGKAKFAC
jgi:pentatricopeptide repeat protein